MVGSVSHNHAKNLAPWVNLLLVALSFPPRAMSLISGVSKKCPFAGVTAFLLTGFCQDSYISDMSCPGLIELHGKH